MLSIEINDLWGKLRISKKDLFYFYEDWKYSFFSDATV